MKVRYELQLKRLHESQKGNELSILLIENLNKTVEGYVQQYTEKNKENIQIYNGLIQQINTFLNKVEANNDNTEVFNFLSEIKKKERQIQQASIPVLWIYQKEEVLSLMHDNNSLKKEIFVMKNSYKKEELTNSEQCITNDSINARIIDDPKTIQKTIYNNEQSCSKYIVIYVYKSLNNLKLSLNSLDSLNNENSIGISDKNLRVDETKGLNYSDPEGKYLEEIDKLIEDIIYLANQKLRVSNRVYKKIINQFESNSEVIKKDNPLIMNLNEKLGKLNDEVIALKEIIKEKISIIDKMKRDHKNVKYIRKLIIFIKGLKLTRKILNFRRIKTFKKYHI